MPWVFATHRRGDVPEVMTHLLELEQGASSAVGAMRAARAASCCARKRRHSSRERAAQAPAAQVDASLVALRRADVYVDDVHILRGIDLEVRAGECWVVHGANGSGKSTLLRTIYGDHAVASSGTIVRAGIVPGVPLETVQAAHRLRRAAPADLARAEDAGDGSGCVRPLCQHRPQRCDHRQRPPARRARAAALRHLRAAPAHAGRDVVRPGAARTVRARLGARARSWRCSTNRSPVSIAPRAPTWRAGSTSGWTTAAAA